jgi:hypothetical protein
MNIDTAGNTFTEQLSSLDALLAEHPFGNSAYITQQMHTSFKRRLGKIAAALPAAGRLVDALNRADAQVQHRVLGDMVLRCAVQHALRQIETGARYGLPLEQCDEIFRSAYQQLEAGICCPLGSSFMSPSRLGQNLGWIWSDECSDNVFTRAFRHLVEVEQEGQPVSITAKKRKFCGRESSYSQHFYRRCPLVP